MHTHTHKVQTLSKHTKITHKVHTQKHKLHTLTHNLHIYKSTCILKKSADTHTQFTHTKHTHIQSTKKHKIAHTYAQNNYIYKLFIRTKVHRKYTPNTQGSHKVHNKYSQSLHTKYSHKICPQSTHTHTHTHIHTYIYI